MRIPGRFALILLCVLISGSPHFLARVSAQTVEDRITTILNQMTIDEKIKQLHAEGGFNTADNLRLGIPGFIMADGPHGVRDGLATSFPVGIGMASMWDTSMARRIGVAMGKEFRGKGKHQGLGPALDIDRDPRNGRSPETGGEDPYLCAQITTAVVRGMQSTPVIATVKHYNANHRENGRTSNTIVASERMLNEDAGLVFRTAVQQGGAFSVMNAYNLINGQKCAENANLLTTILRTRWGFPYYVVSDWGSIWSSEKAIKAGCDICMGSDNYKNDLPGLVAGGTVPVSVIDEAVRRVLRTKLLAGLVDYQPPGNPDDVNSPEHQALCRDAGRKSLVLLKNQGGILPLTPGLPRGVALIGPHAATLVVDGSGSAYVTPFYTVTPRQGIEKIVGAAFVRYAKGCDINSSDTSGFAAAALLAASADAVVFCGGLDGGQEGEGFDRVGGSTSLPGKQQDLINRVAAVNPNVVAVIFSGGVCSLDRCIDNLKGLIYAFYPGQEGGTAVAEAIFGVTNPGGTLPVTLPRNDAQLPPWNDNLDDDYGCGYRWYDKMGYVPQFPFGYGLSYTTFAYSGLTVSPATVAPGEPVTVSMQVTNTGTRQGDEVAQLYLSDVLPAVPMPTKALKGFRRVSLAPGEAQTISFTVTADELYFFNESTNSYDVKAGQVVVRVGGSSDNLPLTGMFTVLSSPRKPDLLITGIRMVPPYPLPGQSVVFLASVKNQGSAATTPGSPLKVTFSVNGSPVSYSDNFSGSIVPGGMALICGNTGAGGVNSWTAGGVGTSTAGAAVDPDNAIDECVETNNVASSVITVYTAPLPSLSLNKPVSVTSVEGPGYEGKNAVDGNMGTRWSSAFSDPQVLVIDLGTPFFVTDIILHWEAAYAKEYYIRIADDTGPWVDVQHVTAGDGGMDRITVGGNARKIMMLGVQRATSYGYSLYEVEVHGGTATGAQEEIPALPRMFMLHECFPNPFNPSTELRYDLPVRAHVTLSIYDMLGQLVNTLVDGWQEAGRQRYVFDARGLASGMYLCRMEAAATGTDGGEHFIAVRKILLLR